MLICSILALCRLYVALRVSIFVLNCFINIFYLMNTIKGIHGTPVFATLPVFKFGQLVLYDFLQNMKMEGADNQDIFSFDDIDTAFQNTITVKYNQRITLQEKGTNIHGYELMFRN